MKAGQIYRNIIRTDIFGIASKIKEFRKPLKRKGHDRKFNNSKK